MTRILRGLVIFLVCLSIGRIGVSVSFMVLSGFESNSVESVPVIEIHSEKPPVLVTDIDAEFDPSVDYATKLKVKLLQTGDFHAEEVLYRSGEKWLGLFKNGDTYTLASTKIRIESGPDRSYNTTVKTTRAEESLFLLRGASNLREGLVTTIYDDSDNDFDSYFGEDPEKTYMFNGQKYILRVENAPDGYLQKDSLLVLESAGQQQILRYLPDGCNDCGWSVEWVGDLDMDGKLDFYLDLNGHYNSYEPTLFLSSSAKKGKLLGIFAGFHGVGC
jgi:hypothetical protein